jgi:hypothetical protein
MYFLKNWGGGGVEWLWGIAWVVQDLPSKCVALSSKPHMTPPKKSLFKCWGVKHKMHARQVLYHWLMALTKLKTCNCQSSTWICSCYQKQIHMIPTKPNFHYSLQLYPFSISNKYGYLLVRFFLSILYLLLCFSQMRLSCSYDRGKNSMYLAI